MSDRAERMRLVAAQLERVEAIQRELQHATDVLRVLADGMVALPDESEGTPPEVVQAWLRGDDLPPTPGEGG